MLTFSERHALDRIVSIVAENTSLVECLMWWQTRFGLAVQDLCCGDLLLGIIHARKLPR